MLVYYMFESMAYATFKDDSMLHTVIRLIPSIIYSCIVIPLNSVYKSIAISLTNWGNSINKNHFQTIKLKMFNSKKTIEHNDPMKAI